MTNRLAGLLYGPEAHHLDHLAPLCSLLEIPLLVSEESIEASSKKYYPNLITRSWDYSLFSQEALSHYSVFLSTLPNSLLKQIFFLEEALNNKIFHSIWCPHGQSDKGLNTANMEALVNEEGAIVYGQKMVDILNATEIKKNWKGFVSVGNYRYQYYLKNKNALDQIAHDEIFSSLPPAARTVLYAPTWPDHEESSSFFLAVDSLCLNLPSDHNLIIKLHPNLLIQESLKVEQIEWKYENKKNIFFLKDFPLIFPLLNRVDLYVGDMSSIGYDFLLFDRPMIFLNPNQRDSNTDPGLFLFRCGLEIPMSDLDQFYTIALRHILQEQLQYQKIRKEVVNYAFGNEDPWEEISNKIYDLANLIQNKLPNATECKTV